MSQINKYLDGFRQWWIAQGHSSRSADIYRSGLKRINDEFFAPVVRKDMFAVLDHTIATGSAVDWLTALIGNINARIEQTDLVTKKRLQDNRSHLKRFIEYISELQDDTASSGYEGVEIAAGLLPEGKLFYSKEMLMQDLSRSISIADYMSPDAEIFLPMRILTRLFSESKHHEDVLVKLGIREMDGKPVALDAWYRRWLRNMVLKTTYHTVKGMYHLSEIQGLLIDRKQQRAWIRVNNKDLLLLTDAGLPGGVEEMRIKTLSDIHILSQTHVSSTLTRLAPVLITLHLFTNKIKATFASRTIKVEKFNFNPDGPRHYNVDIKLDAYRREHCHYAARWYCDNVDWHAVAPLLSLLRTELNYIAAALPLVAVKYNKNKY